MGERGGGGGKGGGGRVPLAALETQAGVRPLQPWGAAGVVGTPSWAPMPRCHDVATPTSSLRGGGGTPSSVSAGGVASMSELRGELMAVAAEPSSPLEHLLSPAGQHRLQRENRELRRLIENLKDKELDISLAELLSRDQGTREEVAVIEEQDRRIEFLEGVVRHATEVSARLGETATLALAEKEAMQARLEMQRRAHEAAAGSSGEVEHLRARVATLERERAQIASILQGAGAALADRGGSGGVAETEQEVGGIFEGREVEEELVEPASPPRNPAMHRLARGGGPTHPACCESPKLRGVREATAEAKAMATQFTRISLAVTPKKKKRPDPDEISEDLPRVDESDDVGVYDFAAIMARMAALERSVEKIESLPDRLAA